MAEDGGLTFLSNATAVAMANLGNKILFSLIVLSLFFPLLHASRPLDPNVSEMTSRPASRILKGGAGGHGTPSEAGGHGTPSEAGGHGTPDEAQGSGGRDRPLMPTIIPLIGAQGHHHSHSAASSRSSDSSSLVVVLVAATMLMAAFASSVVY